jgi:hypothetical protein
LRDRRRNVASVLVSVAEIKAEAARLSVKELAELSRFFREQALRRDPTRREQIARALASDDWLVREEFERQLPEQDDHN